MPVGKNALKRVANNGYSNVAVSAPDMEHSEVISTDLGEEVKEISVKTSPKKNTAPKTKKPSCPKPKAKKLEAARPDGFTRCEIGQDMPVHLL